MLTANNISRQEAESEASKRFADAVSGNDDVNTEHDLDFRAKATAKALLVYKEEFRSPSKIQVKIRGRKVEIMNNSSLRIVSRDAVLKSSATIKRKYSHSQVG